MGWDGMGWDGMGWDGMGWDGMGWDGMGQQGAKKPRIAGLWVWMMVMPRKLVAWRQVH